MLSLFASMLHERRIIVTSRRPSRLSACVQVREGGGDPTNPNPSSMSVLSSQAANDLIYPMHWQHIFIPVLPRRLADYLSAPMPFLIGVPAPIMQEVNAHELGEAVILDADANVVRSPFPDLESLPSEVASDLKRALRSHRNLVGDSIARAFLRALAHLVGGYRDALRFRQGEKITFCEEGFVASRPPPLRPFLRQMLELQVRKRTERGRLILCKKRNLTLYQSLQIFRQFVEERLHMLNTGKGFTDEFEMEAVRFQERAAAAGGSGSAVGAAVAGAAGAGGSKIRTQYAHISSSVKKESGAIVKAVKGKVRGFAIFSVLLLINL